MALAQKYKKFALRGEDYYNSRGEKVETSERVRIIEGTLRVDYSCFKKSKAEKELLKSLRLDSKRDAMKRR